MKQCLLMVVLVMLVAALCVPPGFAQATGTVKGVCKDMEGKPVVGATLEWFNTDNGRHYTLKTNNKGEYFSLGIEPGKYRITLTQDGKQLDQVSNFPVGADEASLDFDLKKSQAEAAQQKGISAEQLKAMQEAQAKQAKEAGTVKTLNEKLLAANTAIQSGDFETAVKTLNEATQIDATRDLLWARLGDANLSSAPKLTDTTEKAKRFGAAVEDYQKAIDLKKKTMETSQKPEDAKTLGAYYNNLAQAESKTGQVDDSVKSYDLAAQVNPPGAAQYYYNQGAVLTNNGRVDQANAAFDKSIAADPNKAEAYYQKGVNLINKATTDPKTGKVIPAPGTEDALNKYLELQPNGPFAEGAKGMIQYIGGTIETSYGSKAKKPAPKK
ncbi:MAG TPA: carboxypeptidase regulatory-like domain-containing protein [Terriglobales bacterium]|nr:carboxypeptidase regulatory-like domain-containing protein [Terriglobales bacterium]